MRMPTSVELVCLRLSDDDMGNGWRDEHRMGKEQALARASARFGPD